MSREFFINTDDGKGKDLILAATKGNIEEVEKLIGEGVDINYAEPNYNDTALSQAALYGHEKVVSLLLNTKKTSQYSRDLALIFASQGGYVGIMKLLIAEEANVNADYFGSCLPPPIYQTIVQNKLDAFRYLIDLPNIELTLVAFGDSSPLLMSAYLGRLEMVESLLIEKEMSPDSENEKGDTARKMAKEGGHQSVIEFLNTISSPSSINTNTFAS